MKFTPFRPNLRGNADVALCGTKFKKKREGDYSGGRAAAATAKQEEEVTWTLTGWSQFPEE